MALKGDVRTKVTVEGTREVRQKLKRTEGSFKSFAGSAGGALTGLMAFGGAVVVMRQAIQVAERLGRAIHELGMRGGEVSAVATAFERLAAPDLLSRLQEQTGWLVDEQRLMQESVQILRSRMISEQDWVRSLGAITRLAQDAGESAEDMVSLFAQMASGGGMEGLGRIGVDILSVRDAVRELGFSMESNAGKTEAMRLVAEQMVDLVGGEGVNAVTNYNDAITRLTHQFEAYRDHVGRAIAEDEDLLHTIGQVEQAMVDAVPDANDLGEAIAELTNNVLQLGLEVAAAVERLGPLLRALRDVRDASNAIGQLGNWPAHMRWLYNTAIGAGRGTFGAAAAAAAAGAPGTGGPGLTDLGPQSVPDIMDEILGGATRRQTAAPTPGHGLPSGGGGGGGGGGGAAERPASRLRGMGGGTGLLSRGGLSMSESTDAMRARWDQAFQIAIEFEERFAAEQQATRMALHSAIAESESIEEAHRERQHEAALERIQRTREAEQELHRERMASLQTTASAASAMGQIFGMIADAQEKESKAADGWRKAQGVAMGVMYGIKAGAEVAEAVASFASQNYPGGAMHLVSAGLFTAQSIAAFTELAQTGGGGSSTSAGAATGAAARPTVEPVAAPPGTTGGGTYNYFSFGRDYGGMGRVMADAQWMRERTGQSSPGPSGVGIEG